LEETFKAIRKWFAQEPYAKMMGMRLVEIGPGSSMVEMKLSEQMKNICGVTHGGAVYSLIDGAFEVAANSYGTVAVALNVNVSYINPAITNDILYAQAKEQSRSRKISTYHIQVKNDRGELIATCQSMAYRKKDPLPFL
jgi:acyl-CoA thioesterase